VFYNILTFRNFVDDLFVEKGYINPQNPQNVSYPPLSLHGFIAEIITG